MKILLLSVTSLIIFVILGMTSVDPNLEATVDAETILEDFEELAVQNLRVTTTSGMTVTCLQPDTRYHVRYTVTDSRSFCSCASIQEVCSGGTQGSFFSTSLGSAKRACVDTNPGDEVVLPFTFGGDPMRIVANDGGNPPIPNCSPIVDTKVSQTYRECNTIAGCPVLGCNIDVTDFGELNGLGSNGVTFIATINRSQDTEITSSRFLVEFENGSSLNYFPVENFEGNLVANISVSCNNKVKKVTTYVNASNNVYNQTCSDQYVKSYPLGVCGSGGGIGIN